MIRFSLVNVCFSICLYVQVELDLGREELHKARETYRKQFLPAEIEPDQLEVKTPSPKPKASKSRKGKK